MKGILEYKLYYFIGVGGIGMSALARYFNHYQKKVLGYDKTKTSLTDQLVEEGISCHYHEDVEALKYILSEYKTEDILVVTTPAVPKNNSEFGYVNEKGCKILKRSEVLGIISEQFNAIAIAGTHGKTTTTTLVTHILKQAGINCFSFMGGISNNYNTNLLLGDINDKNAYVVVEADEYDRSFLHLKPHISVLTSIDADHLDIYGDDKHVKEGYSMFIDCLQKNGLLVVKKNVDNDLKPRVNKVIYSLNLDTEYCADSVRIENARFYYDIKSPVEPISNVVLGLPGIHNVENSIAAVAVAQQLGIKGAIIKEALRSFTGVKRRFDIRVNTSETIYVDDYAHHPEEIKATVKSLRMLFPEKKITGVFQPHLFSRTRDFADDFASSLDLLDECILLEIYPAREKPLNGINSQMLLDKMNLKNKSLLSFEELLEKIKQDKIHVLVTMGAGNIDLLVEPIEQILKQKN